MPQYDYKCPDEKCGYECTLDCGIKEEHPMLFCEQLIPIDWDKPAEQSNLKICGQQLVRNWKAGSILLKGLDMPKRRKS